MVDLHLAVVQHGDRTGTAADGKNGKTWSTECNYWNLAFVVVVLVIFWWDVARNIVAGVDPADFNNT